MIRKATTTTPDPELSTPLQTVDDNEAKAASGAKQGNSAPVDGKADAEKRDLEKGEAESGLKKG